MQDSKETMIMIKEIQIIHNDILKSISIDTVEAFMFADGGAMGKPGEIKYFCKSDNEIIIFKGNRFTPGIDAAAINQVFDMLNTTAEWFHFALGFGNHLCMKLKYESDFLKELEKTGQHKYKVYEEILKYLISR